MSRRKPPKTTPAGGDAAASDDDTESMVLTLRAALQDDRILQLIGVDNLRKSVDELVISHDKLKEEVKEKNLKIAELENKCNMLEAKLDDQEQWSRKGSLRVQGLPEGPDLIEDKLLKLVNEDLKLDPPLLLNEIEVAHRLPHPKKKLEQFQKDHGIADGTPIDNLSADLKRKLGSRSVIVKFCSRRVKSRVMKVRKGLKNLNTPDSESIFFTDDLTASRAKLAFEARTLKRLEIISDTWVWDSKVLIKENNGRVLNVSRTTDLARFEKERQKKLSAAAKNDRHVP